MKIKDKLNRLNLSNVLVIETEIIDIWIENEGDGFFTVTIYQCQDGKQREYVTTKEILIGDALNWVPIAVKKLKY